MAYAWSVAPSSFPARARPPGAHTFLGEERQPVAPALHPAATGTEPAATVELCCACT